MRNTQLVITPYMMQLMRERKEFIFFPVTNQIIIDEQCDEYNKKHGFTDTAPRIIFRHTKDIYGRSGYICNARNTTMSLLIPDELIKEK